MSGEIRRVTLDLAGYVGFKNAENNLTGKVLICFYFICWVIHHLNANENW